MINYKGELKIKWSNYCVLSAAGNDNANDNDDNIICTIKDTKLYFLVVTLSARDNQKLTKLLSKGLERSIYWNEYKTKSEEMKNQYEEIRKLTTGRGKDYTTGCLSDHDYIKSHYRLIVLDSSRQKELDTDPKAIQQIEFVGQLNNPGNAVVANDPYLS